MTRKLNVIQTTCLLLISIVLSACSSSDGPASASPEATVASSKTTTAATDLTTAESAQPTQSSGPVATDLAQGAPVEQATVAAEATGNEELPATFVIVPEETTASYAINEVFLSDNNVMATAVGATSEVQGAMTLNYDEPTASEFERFVVDISTLKSDRSRRDRAIRAMWLESSTYPLATFDVNEVANFPPQPEEGEPISFQLAGDLTVRETTREVLWDVTATLEGDRLTGTATLETMLEDFNIPVPSIAGVLRVTDGITLTLDFVMERSE